MSSDIDLRAELGERLFTLWLGGRWIAPLGDRHLPVSCVDGRALGQVLCAGPRDLQRAVTGLGGPWDARLMAAGYGAAREALAALRAIEGAADPVEAIEAWDLPGEGPVVLLSAASVPMARLAGLLLAAAERGVLWKPAPGAAPSAHGLMRALAPGAQARVAMLHGDHATGAGLQGQGALVWLSDAAPPMPVSLCVPATGPRRR